MNINRRYFLLGVGLVATGIISKQYHDARQLRIQRTISAVFDKCMCELAWTHNDKMQFIHDFMQHPRNQTYLHKINLLSYLYPIYAYSSLLEMSFVAKKIRQFEEMICTRFLLSTDFFYHHNPKTIKYLVYYDPHQRPCTNPLS